jgi:hypothetical protein
MSELKQIFDGYATANRWGNEESRSGPGSTLAYTVNIRAQLSVLLEKFEIRVLFDAPCGDFNWMKEVRLPPKTSYLGADISGSIIKILSADHTSDTHGFMEFDITADSFPNADLWFCRDCLFHLPYKFIYRALKGFCESEIKYIATTNHINSTGFVNRDIQAGRFRLLDLYLEPFCLPRSVLFRIADYVYPHPQREICLWTREQLRDFIEPIRLRLASQDEGL